MSSELRDGQDEEAADFELQCLIQQVCAGSEQAAVLFVQRYGPHVLRAVRKKMPRQLRPMFDSTDFKQSVWKEIFANPVRLCRCKTECDLRGYLFGVARNKVAEESRRRLATVKCDIRRVQPLDSAVAERDLISDEPMPPEMAIANEQVNWLLLSASPLDERVIKLRLDGQTCETIAATVGVHPRTVRKVLSRLETRLTRRA